MKHHAVEELSYTPIGVSPRSIGDPWDPVTRLYKLIFVPLQRGQAATRIGVLHGLDGDRVEEWCRSEEPCEVAWVWA